MLQVEHFVIWRDITQVNARDCVIFSADTAIAERWMRKRYGEDHLVFNLPREHAKAVAFKEAAQAGQFTIIALTRRLSVPY
jgi:hypothetical protein